MSSLQGLNVTVKLNYQLLLAWEISTAHILCVWMGYGGKTSRSIYGPILSSIVPLLYFLETMKYTALLHHSLLPCCSALELEHHGLSC